MLNFMRSEWGLQANLFVSGPPDPATLSRVFTGRTKEIQIASASLLEAPRRVLLNGMFGVGKTVLIRELCRRIQSEMKDVIIVEEQLYSADHDLGQVMLRGLVTALKSRSETAAMYHGSYMGQTIKTSKKSKGTRSAKTGIPKFIEIGAGDEQASEESKSFSQGPDDPIPVIRALLREVEARQPHGRIIITIDDIDKRDPENVRNLLTGSRDLLHTPYCSFILTSHPLGILRDAYATAGGIIDREIDVPVMDTGTMALMVARYLGAGRMRGWKFWKDPEFASGVIEEEALLPFTREVVELMARGSYGIPRVLNIICFNILMEAANRRYKLIGRNELMTCWDACSTQLRRGIRPDLRAMLDLMADQRDPLNVGKISDDVYTALHVDTQEEMVSQIDQGMKNDLLITLNGRDFHLNSILRPAKVVL